MTEGPGISPILHGGKTRQKEVIIHSPIKHQPIDRRPSLPQPNQRLTPDLLCSAGQTIGERLQTQTPDRDRQSIGLTTPYLPRHQPAEWHSVEELGSPPVRIGLCNLVPGLLGLPGLLGPVLCELRRSLSIQPPVEVSQSTEPVKGAPLSLAISSS